MSSSPGEAVEGRDDFVAAGEVIGASSRYAPNPTMMTALRSPRLLTRDVLAGLVVCYPIHLRLGFGAFSGGAPSAAG